MEFHVHIMWKVGLENMTLTGHIEGKSARGMLQITNVTSLHKLMGEQGLGETAKR